VQELKETLAYPHFDFGNSFCTAFSDFTALFAFLIVICIAAPRHCGWSLRHSGSDAAELSHAPAWRNGHGRSLLVTIIKLSL
jgi:hypothetical protein